MNLPSAYIRSWQAVAYRPILDICLLLFIMEMGRKRTIWLEAHIGHLSSTSFHGEHESKENYSIDQTNKNEEREWKAG